MTSPPSHAGAGPGATPGAVVEVPPPPTAEMRGLRVPLRSAPPLQAMTDFAARAAEARVNTLAVRVYRRGVPLWTSEAARRWRLAPPRWWPGGRDVVAELARLCLRHRIAFAAWMDLLPAADLGQRGGKALARRHWRWRMRRFSGSSRPQGIESDQIYLCPSWPEVRAMLGDLAVELTERHPVHALWLEGMRFPVGSRHPDTSLCHCPRCRARVKAELGFDLTEMPLDERHEQYIAWTRWRETQLDGLLEEIVARVREARGAIPVLGGVPAGWQPEPIHRVGLMDWARWVNQGLLDTAAPIDLASPGARSLEERIATLRSDFAAVSPGGRLCPVLPLSDLRAEGTPMLAALRAMPLSGHVWNADPALPSDQDWALMRRVHGEARAIAPEIDPLDSMRAVIQETARLTPDRAPLASFLDDLLAVFQTGYGHFSEGQMGDLLDDLAQYQAQTRDGQVAVADRERATRNLAWLERQLVYLRGRQLLRTGH